MAFTAQLTSINNKGPYTGSFYDTVAIFDDGKKIDEILVPSSADQKRYDTAVRDVVGANTHFTWIDSEVAL